jgi:hypothetical protein
LTHYWVGQQEVDLLVDALHQAILRLSSREGANYPGRKRTC